MFPVHATHVGHCPDFSVRSKWLDSGPEMFCAFTDPADAVEVNNQPHSLPPTHKGEKIEDLLLDVIQDTVAIPNGKGSSLCSTILPAREYSTG